MNPTIEEFTITLKYQVTVDTETGEMTTKCVKRTIDKVECDEPKKTTKKSKKEESPIPQLTLEDNKYCLNSAAVELLGVEPGNKLDIKYEKREDTIVPVIGNDRVFKTKGGNVVSKSFTVACRGSKNEELYKYGTVFEIKPHDTKEGLFILIGDATPEKALDGDENVGIDKSDEDLNIDLSVLVDDSSVEEVDTSVFQL